MSLRRIELTKEFSDLGNHRAVVRVVPDSLGVGTYLL